jgi:hypothetical protein
MHAAEREARGIWIGPGIWLELPESLLESTRTALGPLLEWLFPSGLPQLPALEDIHGDRSTARVAVDTSGWWLEHGRFRERAPSLEVLLLRLQEITVEATARRRQWLLLRASAVTRGSQCVLIVGDQGDAHVLLAVALAALEFRPVSVGLAAFDARRLTPLPLPLGFTLGPPDHAALQALPSHLAANLLPHSPVLFPTCRATGAPEPTHLLFPDPAASPRSLVRPIAAPAARARLCGALTVAPDEPPPFAAVAALLRHARGFYLSLGDLTHALEQLARLLPHWQVD